MSADTTHIGKLGERLARVRRTLGEGVDLLNLGRTALATLLGVSATAYASHERGERQPSVDFLVALRRKTGISLDWLLDPNQPGRNRPYCPTRTVHTTLGPTVRPMPCRSIATLMRCCTNRRGASVQAAG